MIEIIHLRAAKVMGFNIILKLLKAIFKLSKFRYFNTKTPIIPSNNILYI